VIIQEDLNNSYGQGDLTSSGVTLRWQAHSPVRPVAVVIIVHGIGEHQGRYEPVVRSLLANSIAAYTFDLRGHGLSTGTRGHIDSWSDYLLDLAQIVEFVQSLEGDRPLFLLGHSMGALIALDYATQFPKGLAGLIINGVPLRPGVVATPLMVLIAKLLSNFVPKFSLPLHIELDALSTLSHVGQAYAADPLVHRGVSARWGASILKAIERIRGDVINLRVPTLVTHGQLDTINLPEGSREAFAAMNFSDKTFTVYPRSRHEVHNDVDGEEFIGDVCDWVLPRTG
jgi:alpha-beta hydrolase superfamily lysophospholipase